MPRLIDADALCRVLNDHWLATSPSDRDTAEVAAERAAMCRGLDAAMRIVGQMPTVATDINVPRKWISVKDRLPEKDGQYLVCLNQTHLMVVPFAKTLEDVDRDVFKGRDEPGWFEWDTEWCGFYEVTMVTHWMPIPKLPEEVSGDA